MIECKRYNYYYFIITSISSVICSRRIKKHSSGLWFGYLGGQWYTLLKKLRKIVMIWGFGERRREDPSILFNVFNFGYVKKRADNLVCHFLLFFFK